MGGKSRSRQGRKKSTPARRSPGRGVTRRALHLPGLRDVYDAVLASSADLAAVADALDAELWLAANVCAIRAKAPDDDGYRLAMLDLIDEAGRDGRRQCLVLLQTMAAAGPIGLAEPAHLAARRLSERMAAPGADRGVDPAELPGWVDHLGKAEVVGYCAVWTDVFGEFMQVYCEYTHPGPGRRHGLLFTIDLGFQGILKNIDVIVKPADLDQVVADMARDAERDGGRFERIPPADAAGRLRAAVVASANESLPPVLTAAPEHDALHSMLPLAVRRMMTMPGGDEPATPTGVQVAEAWPAQRRRQLAEEFRTAHPDKWDDPDLALMFVARIIDTCVDVLGTRPDRIGPAVAARLFGEVLPATLITPPSQLDQAVRVGHTWVRWLTDAQQLPRGARKQVLKTSAAALTAFSKLCIDRRFNPLAPYVADLSAADTDGPTMQQIVRRRGFAVPLPGQRGDGVIELATPVNGLPAGQTHVDALDPADSHHRDVITAIGQSARGTDARRMPAYAAVVEQLWHDQPPEVWQAVQRLQAAGLPRQQILDRLAQAWQRHGSDTAPGHAPASTDAGSTDSYVTALHTLGRVRPDARRRGGA